MKGGTLCFSKNALSEREGRKKKDLYKRDHRSSHKNREGKRGGGGNEMWHRFLKGKINGSEG